MYGQPPSSVILPGYLFSILDHILYHIIIITPWHTIRHSSGGNIILCRLTLYIRYFMCSKFEPRVNQQPFCFQGTCCLNSDSCPQRSAQNLLALSVHCCTLY